FEKKPSLVNSCLMSDSDYESADFKFSDSEDDTINLDTLIYQEMNKDYELSKDQVKNIRYEAYALTFRGKICVESESKCIPLFLFERKDFKYPYDLTFGCKTALNNYGGI